MYSYVLAMYNIINHTQYQYMMRHTYVCVYAFSASRADVITSSALVRFSRYQQRATATIRIAKDDIVEKTESFHLRLFLPSSRVHRNMLKYGNYQYTTVYIKDSE